MKPLAVNLYTANAKAVRIVAICARQSICKGSTKLRLPQQTPRKITINLPFETPPPVAGLEIATYLLYILQIIIVKMNLILVITAGTKSQYIVPAFLFSAFA